MDDLRDKAQGSVDAVRATDLDGSYSIESPATYSHDEVTAKGEYPIYGDWLSLADDGGYIELTRGLAAVIVQGLDDDHTGPFVVEVDDVSKDPDDGELTYVAEVSA